MRANTLTIQEIAVKGLMIVLGIVGVLGYVRWMMSDSGSGYRVGAAAIGMLVVVTVAWDVATGQWRRKRIWTAVELVLGIGSLIGAMIGPP
jgi:hypothetical protein